MRKPTRLRRGAVTVAIAVGSAMPPAGLAAPPEPSPAALARLAGRTDAAAHDEWRAGLRSSRADVRAAAARALHVSAAAPLVPDLIVAAAGETDAEAAAEIVRALGSLGDTTVDDVILETARRVKGGVATIAGDVLGRARGLRALAHSRALREADPDGAARRALLRAATHGAPEGLTPAAVTALREGDDVSWETVLGMAREGKPLVPAMVAAGLRSPSPVLQAMTYWHLASEAAAGRRLSSEVLEALSTEPLGAEEDVDRHFAREIVARARGERPREDAAWLARARAGERVYLPRRLTPELKARFTGDELRVVETIHVGSQSETIEITADRPMGRQRRRVPVTADRLRAGGTFPRGYATGLLPLTGCRAAKDDQVLAAVVYGRDGRARRVSFPHGGSSRCEEASRLLALSSLAPVGHFPDTAAAEVLVLPLYAAWLTCLEAESPGAAPSPFGDVMPRAAERLVEPRKLVHVNPTYTDLARGQDVEGDVVVEATIGTTGCVYDVRTVRGPTLLALPLVFAITAWAYEPTKLDGRAVAIPMQVSARYNLVR